MPILAPASQVDITVTANSTLTIQNPGGAVRVEYPVGTPIWFGGEAQREIDIPSGTCRIVTVTGNAFYEMTTDTPSAVNLTPVQVAGINAGNIVDSAGGVYGLSEVMPEVLATATATSTQVTGAGVYGWYRCTTATGNITVYDNTAASGKVLVPTTALAVGVFPIGGAGNSSRLAVSTGVTTVLSGAGVVYIGCETG